MRKKRRFLFLVIMMFLFLLVACAQLPTEPKATVSVPTQTPYPIYTPYPTYTPLPTFTPFVPSLPTTVTIDSLAKSFRVYFPGNYALSKQDETYGGGSLIIYDFVQVGEFLKSDDSYFPSQPPYYYRMQFHTRESTQAFINWCNQTAPHEGEELCLLEDYPNLINLYNGQHEAFDSRRDYEDYKIEQFGERYYFTKTRGCGGGYCALREYTTFLRDVDVDVKVVVYVLLHPNDTEKQAELSDKLFKSFYIEFLP